MSADARENSHPRPKRRFSIWHGVWVIALGAVVYWILQQPAPKFPSSPAALTELAVSVGVYAIATILRAARWRSILRRHEVDIKRTEADGLVTVGYMGNNVLPARGGELLRAYLLGQKGASKRGVLGTVIAERVLDAVALGLLFAAFVLGLLGKVKLPSNTPLIVTAIAVVVILAIVLGVLRFARSHHIVERVRDFLHPFAKPARELLSVHGVALLGLSLVIWAFEAAVYWLVSEATGLGLGVAGALYVMVLANLFSLIPAAPGYVGTFDAAVVFAAKSASNVHGGVITTYLLLLRFVLFVPITIVGAIVLFARYGGLRRYRAARAAAGAAEADVDIIGVPEGELAEPAASANGSHDPREPREPDVRDTPAPTTV